MGTRDGGVHALSLEVTPEGSVEKEGEEEEETGTTDKRPLEGEGKSSATSPSGENACSDAHSSSSSGERSRPSTPPMGDLALDQPGEEWLVRACCLFTGCACVAASGSTITEGLLFFAAVSVFLSFLFDRNNPRVGRISTGFCLCHSLMRRFLRDASRQLVSAGEKHAL